MDSSGTKVDIECDGCGKILKNMIWAAYKKHVHNDGKYYCKLCTNNGDNKYINFKKWCIENNKQEASDRWDYELNDCSPEEIGYGCSNQKYYFKCPKGVHKSELKNINSFSSGQEGSMKCNACNSFAQWGIDNIGEDFLEKYWDYEKNININPWKISHNSSSKSKKIWIKCQDKGYHESYDITCAKFTEGRRCPFCTSRNGKVHQLDSLGTIFPNAFKVWGDKNEKLPYKYSPYSNEEVWWKCPEGKHEDYKRKISRSTICDFRCPDCVRERDESFLQEKVRLYIETLKFKILHENKCTIIPVNSKKGKNNTLPFDNEIEELKLIIEVMGMQHYQICGWHKKKAKISNTTPEYELHYQKLKDRYKRIYAKSKGYYYLEIPYWTNDKDNTYEKLIDDKINEVLKSNPIPLPTAI